MEKILQLVLGIVALTVPLNGQFGGSERLRRMMIMRERELALRRAFPFGIRGPGPIPPFVSGIGGPSFGLGSSGPVFGPSGLTFDSSGLSFSPDFGFGSTDLGTGVTMGQAGTAGARSTQMGSNQRIPSRPVNRPPSFPRPPLPRLRPLQRPSQQRTQLPGSFSFQGQAAPRSRRPAFPAGGFQNGLSPTRQTNIQRRRNRAFPTVPEVPSIPAVPQNSGVTTSGTSMTGTQMGGVQMGGANTGGAPMIGPQMSGTTMGGAPASGQPVGGTQTFGSTGMVSQPGQMFSPGGMSSVQFSSGQMFPGQPGSPNAIFPSQTAQGAVMRQPGPGFIPPTTAGSGMTSLSPNGPAPGLPNGLQGLGLSGRTFPGFTSGLGGALQTGGRQTFGVGPTGPFTLSSGTGTQFQMTGNAVPSQPGTSAGPEINTGSQQTQGFDISFRPLPGQPEPQIPSIPSQNLQPGTIQSSSGITSFTNNMGGPSSTSSQNTVDQSNVLTGQGGSATSSEFKIVEVGNVLGPEPAQGAGMTSAEGTITMVSEVQGGDFQPAGDIGAAAQSFSVSSQEVSATSDSSQTGSAAQGTGVQTLNLPDPLNPLGGNADFSFFVPTENTQPDVKPVDFTLPNPPNSATGQPDNEYWFKEFFRDVFDVNEIQDLSQRNGMVLTAEGQNPTPVESGAGGSISFPSSGVSGGQSGTVSSSSSISFSTSSSSANSITGNADASSILTTASPQKQGNTVITTLESQGEPAMQTIPEPVIPVAPSSP